MRDETTAQQQLGEIWAATKLTVRDVCEGEATSGGSQSYQQNTMIERLTRLQ
jgi:hypothetical protein